jgi:hypothetical protein
MKFKRTVLLAAFVVTMGLLLGAIAASGAVPEPATLISPSGTITDDTPTYTWNAVANTDRYHLIVWDSTVIRSFNFTYGSEVCSDGTGECSATPQFVLANGPHEWWIRTSNADGDGDWSDGMSFTVDVSIGPAHVPRTGQTQSYAAGDDGYLQKGVPLPNPRFTDNGDGTVTDNSTELIWLKNADCSGIQGVQEQGVDWETAVALSRRLADGQCGLSDGSVAEDWRLPNIREFQSLVDFSNSNPALTDNHPFIQAVESRNRSYWTSTSTAFTIGSHQLSYDFAWTINFESGESQSGVAKYLGRLVWPVRDGN